VFAEVSEIIQALQELSEDDLRKLIRAFFAKKISNGNVQPLHGAGERGKDAVAVVDRIQDPLGRTQIFFIQVKKGNITQTDWTNRISGQMRDASHPLEADFPRETSRDNPRRLLLFLSGELTPEAHRSVKAWNQNEAIPVEVFDVLGTWTLFEKYGVKTSDFPDLLALARTLSL
jgi:hypothetical protein